MSHVGTEGNVTFSVPKGEMKYQFFHIFLEQINNLGRQISQPDAFSNANISFMINLMIALIPHEDRRIEIKEWIDAELKARLSDKYDSEETKKITIEVYIDSVGQLTKYLDDFMGITLKNRIGFTRKETSDKFKVFGIDDRND